MSAQLMSDAIDAGGRLNLSTTETLVLVILADKADSSGMTYVSIEYIAHRCSKSVKSIGRCVARLVELGLVERRYRRNTSALTFVQIALVSGLAAEQKALWKTSRDRSPVSDPDSGSDESVRSGSVTGGGSDRSPVTDRDRSPVSDNTSVDTSATYVSPDPSGHASSARTSEQTSDEGNEAVEESDLEKLTEAELHQLAVDNQWTLGEIHDALADIETDPTIRDPERVRRYRLMKLALKRHPDSIRKCGHCQGSGWEPFAPGPLDRDEDRCNRCEGTGNEYITRDTHKTWAAA